jgi:hypothetical protein
MSGNSNDPNKDKIDKSLKRLSAGQGYSERGLLDCPILELFPEGWPQIVRAASCDELIREYLPRISDPKDAAAALAALNLNEDYNLPVQRSRLILFGRAWREAHPDDTDSWFNAKDDAKTYGAVRKWWYEGRESLAKQICYEIARRERTQDWPHPAQTTLERFEAAIRSSEPSTSDANPEPQIVTTAPDNEDHGTGRPGRKRTYLMALITCLIVGLGISLFVSLQPGQHAKGETTSYAITIEHRYDGMDPRGKDGPGTRCANPPKSQAVNQVHPPIIGPDGKVVGWVELHTSPVCQVIWAVAYWYHKSYRMPAGWALHIQMIRRVHPNTIQYVAYDTSDHVYGNMLATVSGCVYAKVFFARGSQRTPAAMTPCTPSN